MLQCSDACGLVDASVPWMLQNWSEWNQNVHLPPRVRVRVRVRGRGTGGAGRAEFGQSWEVTPSYLKGEVCSMQRSQRSSRMGGRELLLQVCPHRRGQCRRRAVQTEAPSPSTSGQSQGLVSSPGAAATSHPTPAASPGSPSDQSPC